MTDGERGVAAEVAAPLSGSRMRCMSRHAGEIVGLLWLVMAALAVLGPALAHGKAFGSYDLLSQFGLLHQTGVTLHNLQAGDQSNSAIPWAALAWIQVHHGQLPLWNPYGALGMPLVFNWQAAAFSVPAIVGYLFPLDVSFTVQVLVTLIIAGTGVFVLCRILGLGLIASIFAGTVFQLSGPMLGWLGWPIGAVLAWAGWLFVAGLLVLRGGQSLKWIGLLAVVIAAMVYAGGPEIVALLGCCLVLYSGVVLVMRTSRFGGFGPIARPIRDMGIAAIAGGALSAPLLLPGLQVISASQRGAPGGDPGELVPGNPPLPPRNLAHFITQTFDGLPIAGNHWFGYAGGYSETAAYVGVIALVLGLVAVVVCRRPEVIGFAIVCAIMAMVTFVAPVVTILDHLPLVGTLLWQRALQPLVFGLAVLSGFGMDALVRRWNDRNVLRWFGGGFALAGVVVFVVWVFFSGRLSAREASVRAWSAAWPIAGILTGLFVVAVLAWSHTRTTPSQGDGRPGRATRGHAAGLVLLACETAFLLVAGAPLWSSSPHPFASTPGEIALSRAAGTSVVGLGTSSCFFPPTLGIPPNVQVAYGIQELALYDPMIPRSYFESWQELTGRPAGIRRLSAYCPAITSANLARLYGIGIVLEPAGVPGPKGSRYVTTIAREDLYRIPGASTATLVPRNPASGSPPDDAPGTAVAVTHPDPASWRMVTVTSVPSMLRLRLTDEPGWHANVDGRPVPLSRFAGVMLQLEVPPGHHRVELTYWPTAFTAGIVLAVGTLVAFAGAFAIQLARRSRRT